MTNKFQRIFLIVMDSLGVGGAADADKYQDEGANTFSHLSYAKKDFSIPHLEALGIGNITAINNTAAVVNPKAAYGSMAEASVGKDTLTGHWEMMGLKVTKKFPAFTETGFPQELVAELAKKTGHSFIGNYAASGTEIIKVLGDAHFKTKSLILYTSQDSVMQIAAHEAVIPLKELYRVCQIARDLTMTKDAWRVGRIIARPFSGKDKDHFIRTPNRHDYALSPPGKTVLASLQKAGFAVIAVGKINDIFNGVGITKAIKTQGNADGMEVTTEIAKSQFTGLCFVNLVDFDSKYGHRRNALGYAEAVEAFDSRLQILIEQLTADDLLILTADHGNDPVHSGSDHTRENVPLLAFSKKYPRGNNLGLRKTFADIGATVAENFQVEMPIIGRSFLQELKKR